MYDYRKKLPLMVDRIVETFHPLQVILFGSYARGDFDADSDVDLLVVFPGEGLPSGLDRRERAIEIMRALRPFGVPKDIFVTTPEELATYRDEIGFIFKPALDEGKVLYGQA